MASKEKSHYINPSPTIYLSKQGGYTDTHTETFCAQQSDPNALLVKALGCLPFNSFSVPLYPIPETQLYHSNIDWLSYQSWLSHYIILINFEKFSYHFFLQRKILTEGTPKVPRSPSQSQHRHDVNTALGNHCVGVLSGFSSNLSG